MADTKPTEEAHTSPPQTVPGETVTTEPAHVTTEAQKEIAEEIPKADSDIPKGVIESEVVTAQAIPEKAAAETTQAESQSEPAKPEAETVKAAPEATPPAPEEAPDPDEDDLSDLDDVLDEFAAVNITSKPAPTSSGPGRPTTLPGTSASTKAPEPGLLPDDDDFARSLQAGMAELLGELESSPEMQRQFEELVKELGDGVAAANASEPSEILAGAGSGSTATKGIDDSTAQTAESSAKAEASFQETIRATMERMSASNASATTATQAPGAGSEDDFLAAMLREMEAGGGGGAGGDEDFSKMLLGMMEQLTNKDILYEPMKELHDKFPEWLEVNRDKVDKADLERYEEQQRLVGEIVGKFEEKGYKDEKVEYREYIVDRMQKMQAAGSPPPDLVGDMNAAQEAMGDMDAGCPQQ